MGVSMKAQSSKRSAPQGTNLAGRLKELQLLAEYRLLNSLQASFGSPFWTLEQCKGRVADKLANRGIEI